MKYQIVISFETAYRLTPTESKFLAEALQVVVNKTAQRIIVLSLCKVECGDAAKYNPANKEVA